MNEADKNFKWIIQKIKSEFTLIPEKNKFIDLDFFSTLDKGDAFKINYKWKVDNFETPVYLISINNSYRLNIVNPSLEKTLHLKNFKYLYCYLEFLKGFPNSLIRPNALSDKLVNIFKHFDIRLPNRKKFNRRYVLESTNKDLIKRLLSDELIDILDSTDEISIEVRNNKCLMKYLRPANYHDTLQILKLVQEILKFDKNGL